MLRTRLWMGTVLVLVTAGMLIVDQRLSPWFPFLFAFVVGLGQIACRELVELLGPGRRTQALHLYLGVALLGASNWLAHVRIGDAWGPILGMYAALLMTVFLSEMTSFVPPTEAPGAEGGAIERMARTMWALGYLGLLPCFLAQLRWVYPANQPQHGSVALALVIFVPKCCDIGAYLTGRLIGRHPMTPVLSPKKTWEGAIGGLTLGVLTAVAIDRLGPAPLLGESWALEIGFGLSLGIAGMLGDLAESLLKRDCRRKDASAVVPGFGGVLDVVDAVLFAAPVGYLWLVCLRDQ